MPSVTQIRFDVPNRDRYDSLLTAPLPGSLKHRGTTQDIHRDEYFDTPDGVLEARGVRCRIRHRSDGRRTVTLWVPIPGTPHGENDQRFDESVQDVNAVDVFAGSSEPARRLRAFTDPLRLRRTLEIEVERTVRRGQVGIFPWRRVELILDTVTVRRRVRSDVFYEATVRRFGRTALAFEETLRSVQDRFRLRSILIGKHERAEKRLRAMESDDLARVVRDSREVTFVAISDRQIAVLSDGRTMFLPCVPGDGEDACRSLLKKHLKTSKGRLKLLGTSSVGNRPLLEVWLVRDIPAKRVVDGDVLKWIDADEIMARVGSPVLRDPPTLAALAVVARANQLPMRKQGPQAVEVDRAGNENATLAVLQTPLLPETSLDASQPVPDQFVNEQLSWIEFNSRVLELAEDPGTPLLARLLFLSIFSGNLDEFYMVRVGALKQAIRDGADEKSFDGLSPQEELDAISVRLAPLVVRQQRVFHRTLLPKLDENNIHVKNWKELDDGERTVARQFFDRQIFPTITPQAMTEAPGHPFPHLPNLTLSLAVVLREPKGPVHFAHVRVPAGIPRFIKLGPSSVFIPVEQLIAAYIDEAYRGRAVESVHAFRITRSGDINIDEDTAASLLRAVEEEVRRRPFGAVVRIEVEAGMPQAVRDLLQRELSFEDNDHASTLTSADFVEASGLVDLASLAELANLPCPKLKYPEFVPRSPIPNDRSIFDTLAKRDVLVHHPYDAFGETVLRLIGEAADDPDVVAIKLTLYRSGRASAIVDALLRAVQTGKEVSVFVELKARFDEERNIHWAKRLERAGIHVVTGLVRLKTHAKIALVIRREGDGVARYVHIGTGNYNESTARLYTDLGLLSSNEQLASDLNDLFNEFTGSSRPPQTEFRELLVAPKHMLGRFLELIEAEAEHARAGREGRIRAKLNGLADGEIIAALYRASQAGVQVDLIVRGICSLRPGVPGLSDRVRVYSILGRFLEHARIYHFANGGKPRYFIGSADWRPRNLRKRVEVIAPVHDPDAQARLDQILETELDDPYAWQMRSDGRYERRPPPVGLDRIPVQDRLVSELAEPG